MWPRAFAVPCGDPVPTPPIRYTTIRVFYRGGGVASIAGCPPLSRLSPIPWEQAVLATVHDHHGKRVWTLIGFQVLTPDPSGTGSDRCRDMFGAIEKCDGHGSSSAIGMAGEKNPFLVDAPFPFDQSWYFSQLFNGFRIHSPVIGIGHNKTCRRGFLREMHKFF